MANFLKDILKAVGEETIEAFRFDSKSATYYLFSKDKRNIPDELLGNVITWEQAKQYCDYEYDDGYGGMDCHDVVIWTKDSVYYIHEYDGSTCFHNVDRNPVNIQVSEF